MPTKIREAVQKASNPEKARFLAGFFKTKKGEYAEGDIFLGITVPESRKIASKYKDLSLVDIKDLLRSKFHEERLIALLILIYQFSSFAKASEDKQKEILDFYLAHTKYINNWDLVDLSADKIVGEYLYKISASVHSSGHLRNDTLLRLANSKNIWEKRIAMIATFAFIKRGQFDITFAIADILLQDKHDLIQKAVGWMLREVGKRVSQEKEEAFLKTRYRTMPRTALRYAIERFPEEERKKYLAGKI